MISKPFVKIIWWDAEDSKDIWVEPEEAEAYAESACVVVSWGYLVKKNRAYAVLAADIATNSSGAKTFGRVTKIPTGCIRSVRVAQRARAA